MEPWGEQERSKAERDWQLGWESNLMLPSLFTKKVLFGLWGMVSDSSEPWGYVVFWVNIWAARSARLKPYPDQSCSSEPGVGVFFQDVHNHNLPEDTVLPVQASYWRARVLLGSHEGVFTEAACPKNQMQRLKAWPPHILLHSVLGSLTSQFSTLLRTHSVPLLPCIDNTVPRDWPNMLS